MSDRIPEKTKLINAKGEDSKTAEIAGDIADRISALEKQQGLARREGDVDLLKGATAKIQELKSKARENGLSEEEFPGIFKSY